MNRPIKALLAITLTVILSSFLIKDTFKQYHMKLVKDYNQSYVNMKVIKSDFKTKEDTLCYNYWVSYSDSLKVLISEK
jgi:hypothetical protein